MTTFTVTTTVNGSSLTRLGSVAALAWTRATTTATVTQNNHGMVSGDLINVTVTSDVLAIVLGVKTVTVLTASTYTFTCLNGGAASGTVTAAHIDDYLINGGFLTIDTHTRYGLGSNTSAGIGDIVMSASLGGTIEFNSTLVRCIPYNTGSGNVPALDTTISISGANGKLLGVYSALNVAPTTAGSAMPASGFILIRQWNSVAFAAGALTGIAASATGVDVAGWLEIVGVDALTCTVNRLNTFRVRGDYYFFQGVTTDGTRATTYQIPSNGAIVYLPGVEVETGTASGIYEFYPCAGSMAALAANIATDAVRGRWCWISTAGLLRFGHDGTNSTGGYIPPAGRKIRIPNIFFMSCTQAAQTVNVLPNATLATRYEFSTAGGGVLDIDKSCSNWYFNINQPYSVALTNSHVTSAIVLTECASPIAWSNVGVGQEAANTQTALLMSLNFAGGTMDKCVWSRAAQAGAGTYITSWADCSGFTVTNERNHSLTKAANATSGTTTQTRVALSTWTNTTLGGGRVFQTTCTDVTYLNSIYYDHPSTTTSTGIPMFAFDILASCVRVKYDGLTFGGLTLVQPYSGILQIGAAGCTDIKLRNLGTAASPLDMGGAYVTNAAWTRATTTMTVTQVAHGLKANDLIAVNIVSDVAPRAVTNSTASLWTVLAAPTADTFTITVTNAGAASGTMSYYPTMAGQLVVFAAGAAANNVKIQRCYTPRLRTGLGTADNSSKNLTYESVWGTEWGVMLTPMLNLVLRNVQSFPALTAQTSCYGTFWFDYYHTGIPANIAGVAWTRATTTATITSNDHLLKTGDQIVATVTSDAAAIVLGTKTITATTHNAFTFACLNAGTASGTLTFTALNSRVALLMNEATADNSSFVSLVNGAKFTSAGSLYMPVINDQATFQYQGNLKGHSSFPVVEAVMAGGTIGNYDITYSLNDGVTYKNLYYQRAGGGGSAASANVTMTDTTGVAVGDFVFGTGIAPLAKVNSITNGTTVVVNIVNTGAVSGVLRFNQLPSEVVADPTIGFPLQLRLKTTTTNATAITSLYFITNSTTAARAATYSLDTVTVTVSGNVTLSGSEVRVYDLDNSPAGSLGTELSGSESSGATFAFVAVPGNSVWIQILKDGYVEYSLTYTVPTVDTTLSVILASDPNI